MCFLSHTCFFFSFTLQVSWIRKRDLHILTAGSTTYTSDQRFQVSSEIPPPPNPLSQPVPTLHVTYCRYCDPITRPIGHYKSNIRSHATPASTSAKSTRSQRCHCPTHSTLWVSFNPLEREYSHSMGVSYSYRLTLETLALLYIFKL